MQNPRAYYRRDVRPVKSIYGNNGASWNDAAKACSDMGRHLVSVRNFEELDLLLDFIRLHRRGGSTGVFLANIEVGNG